MRTVFLYGDLAKTYGDRFELGVETASEAVRCLSANFPNFARDLAQGTWRVVAGKTAEDGHEIDEISITSFRLGRNDLHFVPVIEGAKGGNSGAVAKAVIGVVLVGLSLGFAGTAFMSAEIGSALFGATTWGNAIGMIGVSMALAGMSTLLTPEEKTEEEKTSYVNSGPRSTVREGAIVPIAYGEVMVGGGMISGGVRIEVI